MAISSNDGAFQSILNSWTEVQKASAELYRYEAFLRKLATKIENKMDFDFVAIQLIRHDEQIIETVYGTGVAKKWIGKAKHYLDEFEELRDIQTDIAVADPPRAEVICGWDDRFDEWIYRTYNHKSFIRLFAPLIIFRDNSNKVIDRWWELARWRYVDEIHKRGKRRNDSGRMKLLELEMPEEKRNSIKHSYEIIGTVEVGYTDQTREITPDNAIALINLVSEETINIQKALLPCVLERIVENALAIVMGDSASLHFQKNSKKSGYVYEVRAGKIPFDFLKKYPPRKGKMGEKALKENKVFIIPDPSKGKDTLYLKEYNPDIYDFGIRAIAAFPLIVDKPEKEGVLYIHFREPHTLEPLEIDRIKLYANQVCDVIRNATIYMERRDSARQLKTLHSVVQSLVSIPKQKGLLETIAWSTLNMTGSDIVTIYEYRENEYIPVELRFKTPPAGAGRFRDNSKMRTKLYQEDAPILLVNNRSDVWETGSPEQNEILNKSELRRDKLPFVVRENIKSTAGLLLKVGEEIVGVMFINYRRQHTFLKEEKEIIQTLASSAAIAIQNRRELAKTQESLMTITHQLELPLISIKRTLSDDFIRGARHEEIIHQIEKARAWAEGAFALCNGTVRTFAREAGQDHHIELSTIDIQDEIRQLRELMELSIKPQNLKFPYFEKPDFPLVKMDKQIFINVMYSLIYNAFKYADRNSDVEVRCIAEPKQVISVKTTGEPIADDEKELIFEKFRRGKIIEKTGRHHSGVGLGLWVARELMRSIGGDVTVHTDPERERVSEFIVSLPDNNTCL